MRTIEYSLKKHIRNNAVVRELDEARQRELWRSTGIGFVVIALVLLNAWQHFELRRHGYLLEQMRQQRASEEAINRHLRLEIASLRAPARIEALATERLRLVAPGPNDAIVIQRVAPAEPPPKSVVAQR